MAAENSNQAGKKSQYRCFLLRCRLEGASRGEPPDFAGTCWRFVIQQVGPHAEIRLFTRPKDVGAYLEAELESLGKQAG